MRNQANWSFALSRDKHHPKWNITHTVSIGSQSSHRAEWWTICTVKDQTSAMSAMLFPVMYAPSVPVTGGVCAVQRLCGSVSSLSVWLPAAVTADTPTKTHTACWHLHWSKDSAQLRLGHTPLHCLLSVCAKAKLLFVLDFFYTKRLLSWSNTHTILL